MPTVYNSIYTDVIYVYFKLVWLSTFMFFGFECQFSCKIVIEERSILIISCVDSSFSYCNAGGFYVMEWSRPLSNLGHGPYGSSMILSAVGCDRNMFHSVSSRVYLSGEILIFEHAEAECWYGHLYE